MLMIVDIGTPSCPVTAAAETSALARPTKRSPKLRQPISMAIRNRVPRFFGTGRRNGIRKTATPKKRIAAKKSGGTLKSDTTQRVMTRFTPQTKQMRKRRAKSRKDMLRPYQSFSAAGRGDAA